MKIDYCDVTALYTVGSVYVYTRRGACRPSRQLADVRGPRSVVGAESYNVGIPRRRHGHGHRHRVAKHGYSLTSDTRNFLARILARKWRVRT